MSNFAIALDKLGFANDQYNTSSEKVGALLSILDMAGYFEESKLWHDINFVPSIPDKVVAYVEFAKALKLAKTNTGLNAEILYKALEKDSLSAEQWMDLLLYITQNAFNRDVGRERNELVKQDWMTDHAEAYKNEAKKLGLIDRKRPLLEEYDQAWIAGTSRPEVLARIQDYKYTISKGIKIKSAEDVVILAGQRELWANIDGLTQKAKEALSTHDIIDIDLSDISIPAGEDAEIIAEGKDYLIYLAKKYNILYNINEQFVTYEKGDQIPNGLTDGRTYLNYAEGETGKLTESLMCKDLFSTHVTHKVKIVDTQNQGGKRPDTTSTAIDAAKALVAKIKSGAYPAQKEFSIIYFSNNPYIERQTLATQRAVNKVLQKDEIGKQGYKINVEGVGFFCVEDVVAIHSELAALITEKWKNAHLEMLDLDMDTHLQFLQFQSRDNATIIDTPVPNLGDF
jgi:hypothetical protein